MNRRHLLVSTAALILGGAAARTDPAVAGTQARRHRSDPGGSAIPFARPGGSWTGTADSGVTAPLDSTYPRTTFKPVAYFLTVPDQVFAADFTVHVMARAPGGIASVEFFHENATTTTVTTSRLNTITKAAGTTKARDTYAITLKYADWSAHMAGIGGHIYAKVTANAYLGVTPQPRVIGPLRVIPRSAVNDMIITVSADGTDSTGASLPNATWPGATYTTIDAALDALYALSGAPTLGQTDCWLHAGMPCAPKIVLAKTGFYPIRTTLASQSRGALGWTTITPAPGVTATIGRTSAPSYSDTTIWPWRPSMAHIEFRGPNLILDHKNWTYLDQNTGYGGPNNGGVPPQPIYGQTWMNGCKNTNSCATYAPATQSGRLLTTSPMFNTYWSNGAFPGWDPKNNWGPTTQWQTDDVVEYVGGCNADLLDGTLIKECPGDPIGGRCALHTYTEGCDTRYFEPDTKHVFHMAYTGGGTLTVEVSGATTEGTAAVRNGGTDWVHGAGAARNYIFIRLNGTLQGGSSIPLGIYYGDANYSWTQIKATIDALAISGLTVTIDDTVDFGGPAVGAWASRALADLGTVSSSRSIPVTSTPLYFTAFPDIHTEWIHPQSGGGPPIQQNWLIYGNTIRNSMFGTSVFYDEGGMVDGYVANNAFQVIPGTVPADPGPFNFGYNVTSVHNWNDAANGPNANSRTGDAVSIFSNNILASLGGNTSGWTETCKNNIENAASAVLGAYDATNLTISDATYAALFRDYTNGDFRAAVSGYIDGHKATPVEKYDMFYNLRPASDWIGPISSVQASAPSWPF